MFEKNLTKQGKQRLMALLCLTDGREVEGEVFCAHGERLADVLNDQRAFIPVQTAEGDVQVLAKASIATAHIVGGMPREERDPYKVLRVAPTASDAELRAAWMAGLKASHPDRLASLHMDEMIVYAARKACQRINAAYDQVTQERQAAA